MKWTRAVHHLETLAQSCSDLGSRPAFSALRVEQLWVTGEVLDEPHDVEVVTVALVVDLPVEDVPWLSEPAGAQHWANGARLGRTNPTGQTAALFDALKKRQAIAGSIAGTLGLLALLGGVFSKY